MIKIRGGYGKPESGFIVMGESDLYDLVTEAVGESPYDGRTKQGRAWSDGAWSVMKAFKKLSEKATEVPL